jgi:hypothetical protein
VSTDVEGLLSKITGTVSQVESLSGGITGNVGGHIKGIISGTIKNLSGSVTSHASVTSRPHVTLEWYMEDANGKRLTENTDFVMLNKTTLTIDNTDLAIPPPSLVFLPVFAEASVGVDLITRRRIFCIVTVEVGSDKGERVLGPVDILLPKIQLPTVLVMTEKKGDGVEDPGAVLVAIPSESSLTPDLLSDKLGGVKDALERIKTLSGFTGFDQTVIQIGNIIVLINPSVRRATYVKQDQVMDLWWVSREPGFFGFGYKSWEDCINRLIMLGPPGRIARFHVAKNLWERLGAFEIELGLHAVGHINDLSETPLTCEPTEAGGCILRQRWDPPPSTFKDAISSFQFLPLQ